jgi:hypothetical protein
MDFDSLSEFDSDSQYSSDEDSESGVEENILPLNTSTPRPRYSIGVRIQAVTFLDLKILQPEITTRTGISKSQIYALCTKAITHGWVSCYGPRLQ